MSPPIASSEVVAQLKVLTHPARVNIIRYLSTLKKEQGSASVTEIYTALNLPQAIASQQLIAMKDRGLLKSNKVGTSIFYSIALPWLVDVVKVLDKQAA